MRILTTALRFTVSLPHTLLLQAANVLTVHDVSNIYHVPLKLVEQNLHNIFKEQLGLVMHEPEMTSWSSLAHQVDTF
jgi:CTP synthase (UTP-ammonia lyase)